VYSLKPSTVITQKCKVSGLYHLDLLNWKSNHTSICRNAKFWGCVTL